jgi:hypothetical protein
MEIVIEIYLRTEEEVSGSCNRPLILAVFAFDLLQAGDAQYTSIISITTYKPNTVPSSNRRQLQLFLWVRSTKRENLLVNPISLAKEASTPNE